MQGLSCAFAAKNFRLFRPYSLYELLNIHLSLQDRTISFSRNNGTMIGLLTLTAISNIFILLGQYLALEGQYDQLSTLEKILNLMIFPCITIYWQMLLIYPVPLAMLLALAQKLIEKLENVPENGVDTWIFDSLTLFNEFEPKVSHFCFIVISIL